MKEKYTLIINLSLRNVRVIVFDEKGKKKYQDWLKWFKNKDKEKQLVFDHRNIS